MMPDQTLAEILCLDVDGAHNALVERVNPADDFVAEPGRIGQTVKDPLADVAEWIRQGTGRVLGPLPTWIRFVRPDRGAGLVLVLSAPAPGAAEVDLVVVGHPGMISRPVMRAACQWAFNLAGVPRVVVRIPVGDTFLCDLARRAGFRHEGVSRSYFDIGADASVWAMTRQDCPWLPRPVSAIPVVDTSPPASTKVH